MARVGAETLRHRLRLCSAHSCHTQICGGERPLLATVAQIAVLHESCAVEVESANSLPCARGRHTYG